MQIKETSIDILDQLEGLVIKMEDDQYTEMLECLFENSVGKHIRHILEFYELMINGFDQGRVNYDKRKHDLSLEEDRKLAIEKIQSFKSRLNEINEDIPLTLETSYDIEGENSEIVRSSFMREMVYNIEHAIHHMAIIKIGVRQAFPQFILNENFGIAYSTVKYRRECAQ